MNLRSLLIVEDHGPTQLVLRRLAESLKYTVTAAGSLSEAFERLEGHGWVILDLNLPDGEGTQFLRTLSEKHPATKVAIFSSTADAEQLRRAAQCGPDVFLSKTDFQGLKRWLVA